MAVKTTTYTDDSGITKTGYYDDTKGETYTDANLTQRVPTGSIVDTALGPLEEAVVRATLTDAQSGNVVAETNLIGRSKATSSRGAAHLSAAVGKALDKWLKEGGL